LTRVIGIVSGKGGVGKTTLTVNLGVALSKLGKKVIVVDCNLSTPHLSYYLGAYKYTTTLNDALLGRTDIKNALYHHNNVMFVPASLAMEDLVSLDIIKLKKHIDKLVNEDMIDFILLDSAPGLGREAVSVLNSANEILYVTTPSYPHIRDVVRCADVVKEFKKHQLGIVLNMTDSRYDLPTKDIEAVTRLPVLGKIPYDKSVMHSLHARKPVVKHRPYSAASINFMKIAAALVKEEYTPPKSRRFYAMYDKLRAAILPHKSKMTDFVEEGF